MATNWKLRRFSAWGLILATTAGTPPAAPPSDCLPEARLIDPAFERLVREGPRCGFFTRHGMQHRPPIASPHFGALTPYWAQEMSGLDLASESLDEHDSAHPEARSQTVPVGILDEGGLAASDSTRTALAPPERMPGAPGDLPGDPRCSSRQQLGKPPSRGSAHRGHLARAADRGRQPDS